MAKVTRLLEELVPEKYTLSFDVDMDRLTYQGRERLTFRLVHPSKVLTLHAVGLDVSLASLDDANLAAEIALNEAEATVSVTFAAEIPAGDHTLHLTFGGKVSDSLHGFYQSHYSSKEQPKVLATTQFEAIHAREAFICIDEPSAKAVFEIDLTIPEAMIAVSNAAITGEEPAQVGRKKVTFAATPKMSTYLVAFIVGDLEYVQAQAAGGIDVRVYATPGQTSQLGFALDAAVRILDYFNEYFGTGYPLPKLDLVTVPDFSAGAMENWGCVTFRDTALLVDPAKTSLANRQRVAEVIAHELAHMWFGDLVTMSWWDDLWLNEGFATWVASLAMDKLWPEWQVWTQFIQEEYDQGLEMDSLANTHPIQVQVDDPKGLDEIFDSISYAKGASILNMIHHYLGADAFKAGLRSYLSKHAYGNTVTADLWKALEEASGKPVTKIMPAWTGQPGYPVLEFAEGSASQTRFYSSPKEARKAGTHERVLWPIPFSAQTAEGETDQSLFELPENDLPAKVVTADWFKPNPGQTSFYRSLYSEHMIAALSEPMKSGKLDPTDRFGVVSDVFATTESGATSSTVALKLTQAMRHENDYVVWGGLTAGFGGLVGMIEDNALRDQFDEYGRWLVAPNVERLGWDTKDSEDTFTTLMRPVVLHQAVRFDDKVVTKEARKRFESYLSGGILDPNIRPVILYAAARNGGKEEFDAIRERYLKETSPQVKISLLASLGHFRKKDLIKEFLAFGLSPDVRPQDIYIVVAWAFRNREGRDMAWTWMKDNWPEFLRRYGEGGHMLERFPLYAASGFSTTKMAGEIAEFFNSHPHAATKRPTAQAVESIELRADWFARDGKAIREYLASWRTSRPEK